MIRTLTYDMAMAAARDEANRNMRRMGRKAWDADDYNVAVETFERIFVAWYGIVEGTLDAYDAIIK